MARVPPARPSAWGGLTAVLDTPAKRGVALVVILAAMVVAPLVLGPYATVILTNALLYVVLALGLNIVVGYAGLLDLGFAAFFAVGAYTVGIGTLAVRAELLAGAAAGRRPRRASPASSSARRRCGCAPTTSPSSPWASARSSASRRAISATPAAPAACRASSSPGCSAGTSPSRSISTTCSASWRSSPCWSRCGSPIPASAAPGSMSATTRTPPRRWASTGCG